ncbi:MAG: ATP-binding protein [Bacteroidales bacterium]|nr:ATP-binding protein [Bacteroidales bacterium]
MKPTERQKLPVGIQSFAKIREKGYTYVDKTALIYELGCRDYAYFLSRPRRFGKSLLLDTMQAYFEGKKHLFQGLAIMELEKDWTVYPVIRLDLSQVESTTSDKLEDTLSQLLREEYKRHNLNADSTLTASGLFRNLINTLYSTTGKGVVLLIDEYDKGLVDVLRDEERLESNTQVLRPFFTQIKAQGECLRFTFITGVARFRHVTIFSGLNNLNDISLDSRYATICGFTQEELASNFNRALASLADEKEWSMEYLMAQLKQKYDGYRFTGKNVLVYNPFSIVNCLEKMSLDNYWVYSGTSKILVDFIRQSHYDMNDIDGAEIEKHRLGDIYTNDNPLPLFYQTGYLTISSIHDDFVTLTFPNAEVRQAMLENLAPVFMEVKEDKVSFALRDVKRALADGEIDAVMRSLQSLLASVPYHLWDNEDKEKTYHRLIHVFFMMAGVATQSERAVSGGRIDMLCQSPQRVYIFEFKLDGSAEEALRQINGRGYPLRWSADGREVYKIGVSFSSEKRNINAWLIEASRS